VRRRCALHDESPGRRVVPARCAQFPSRARWRTRRISRPSGTSKSGGRTPAMRPNCRTSGSQGRSFPTDDSRCRRSPKSPFTQTQNTHSRRDSGGSMRPFFLRSAGIKTQASRNRAPWFGLAERSRSPKSGCPLPFPTRVVRHPNGMSLLAQGVGVHQRTEPRSPWFGLGWKFPFGRARSLDWRCPSLGESAGSPMVPRDDVPAWSTAAGRLVLCVTGLRSFRAWQTSCRPLGQTVPGSRRERWEHGDWTPSNLG